MEEYHRHYGTFSINTGNNLFALKMCLDHSQGRHVIAGENVTANDSINKVVEMQRMLNAELDHSRAKLQQHLVEERISRQRSVILLILMIFIGMAMFFLYDRNVKRKYINLRKQLDRSRVNQIISESQTDEATDIAKIWAGRFNLCLQGFSGTEWMKRLQVLDGQEASEYLPSESRNKLSDSLMEYFTDIIIDLKANGTGLTVDDIILCLLTLLGLKNLTISRCIAASEGAVSDKEGRFVLPKARLGYILEVSLLGYSKYSEIIDKDNIFVILKEDTEFLEGAKVTETLPTHTVRAGSIITTVSGSVMSRLGTANDVIEQIPGIRKEDGKFTVFGKGTPLIYINGRKVQDSSELDRLRSEDVASVELNMNPGPRYDAEVKSVLIIKTVRKAGDGLSGNLRSTFRQGHYSAFQEGADLNWRKGGLDVFGSLEANFSHIYQKQSNRVTTTTPSSVWNQNSDLSISNKGRQYYSTLGFNYMFRNGNALGLRYQRSDLPFSHSLWPTSQEVLKDGIFQEAIDYDILWKAKHNYADGVNAYFQGKVGGFSVDFNNDFYDSRSKKMQDIHERGTAEEKIGNESDVYNMMLASKLIVGHSIGKAKIEGGYEYVRTSRDDAYTSSKSGLAQTDNRIRQNLAAGFLSLSIPFGKASLDAGVRYEHSAQNYYEYGTLVPEQSRKYSNLFPTLDFTFPIAKANFSLSYSSKTKRPSYSQLNSAVQYDDRYTYEQGNPHLQPETNHDITFAGIFKWIYFSASYQYVKDAIAGRIVPYEEESPINLMTSINYDHISKYSSVISFSPKFGLWSPRLRFSLMGQDFDIEHNGSVLRMNSPLLFSSLYNTFNLGKGFLLNADATHHTAGDIDVVTLKPSWQINLGASKNIRGRDIQLQITDIFKTANNSMFTYGSQMVRDKWNYSDSRALKLTLRYRFNSTSTHYKGQSAGASERNRF